MGKLATPDWIREGYDSKADWQKAQGKKPNGSRTRGAPASDAGEARTLPSPSEENRSAGTKTFKVKFCPKCGGSEVQVIVGGEEGKGVKGWECKSCSWEGENIKEKEMSEDEFLEHIEKIEEEEDKNSL